MIIDKLGAGHYQTNTGLSAVIFCLDAPGGKPVIGYVIGINGKACAAQWTKNGKYSEWADSPADLIPIPIPVPRKPREVWIEPHNVKYLDEEGHWVNDTKPHSETAILFREVMEDDNA